MARRRPDPAPQPEDPAPQKSAAKSRAPMLEKKAKTPAANPRRKKKVALLKSDDGVLQPTPSHPPTSVEPAPLTKNEPANSHQPDSGKTLSGTALPHALEARTPPPESGSADHPGLPRSACLPRVVFLLLLLLGGTMAALEVRNVLRHPSVLFRTGPKDAPRLVFYQKGHASAREAFLLEEPAGPDGPPRLIQRIDCRPQFSDIGEIRWTADGRAVYAAGRTPQSRGVPVIRWLYEFAARRNGVAPPDAPADSHVPKSSSQPSGEIAAANAAADADAKTLKSSPLPESRLYISEPGFAIPGRTAFVENPAALTARWKQHQGAGPIAAAWYELGARGDHLFSWQTTRWEKALAD